MNNPIAKENYLTVTALTKYLARKFDVDPYLKDVILIGEISNFNPKASRHRYFSLKDQDSKISAVMFKNIADSLNFKPEEGMRVIVQGRVALYGPNGTYQINIKSMQPDGIGALYQAFEQLKRKLQAEGVFDRVKKPLLKYPKQIAVITSPSGAVIRDILTTIKRRYPIVGVTVFPTRVQGQEAKEEIVQSIEAVEAQKEKFDVIILARGGGSIEDLWSFNEEIVARAILASSLPIISSIGHETDVTIADFVADVRAATPTAAAELAVPMLSEINQQIDQHKHRLILAMQKKLELLRHQLKNQKESYILQDPQRIYQTYSQRLDDLTSNLEKSYCQDMALRSQQLQRLQDKLSGQHMFQRIHIQDVSIKALVKRLGSQIYYYLSMKDQAFKKQVQILDVLSPLKSLSRGYSIVEKGNNIVKSIKDLKINDSINIKMSDGQVLAKVDQLIDKGEVKDGE